MGEHGRAAASLWLEHAPSIGLAIGPRQVHSLNVASQLICCHVNILNM